MRRVLSLVGAVLLLAACQPSFGVYDLRCEGLTEPLGIDGTNPHFSWKIRSDKPMEQAAFEIEVGPGLWQSGKVESSEQVMVPYGGAPLAARQQAWWRVRVWDAAGKVSAWSPRQRFGIGVLDGLRGDFIGAVPGDGRQPVLRKASRRTRPVKLFCMLRPSATMKCISMGKRFRERGLRPCCFRPFPNWTSARSSSLTV